MQRAEPRLLIVDDEEGITDFLSRAFTLEGFSVATASGGWDAIAIVEEQPFEMVLADLRMPRGDGIELLERIEAIDPSKTKPLVALMTAYSDVQPAEVYERGGVALIDKPLEYKEVVDRIRNFLAGGAVRWQMPSDHKAPPLRISLTFGDFAVTSHRGEVALGRGGLFVSMAGALPRVDTIVSFALRFDGKSPVSLGGVARVAWARSAVLHGFYPGIGLEFVTLTPPALAFVTEEISVQAPRSYVPIGLKPPFVKAAT